LEYDERFARHWTLSKLEDRKRGLKSIVPCQSWSCKKVHWALYLVKVGVKRKVHWAFYIVKVGVERKVRKALYLVKVGVC